MYNLLVVLIKHIIFSQKWRGKIRPSKITCYKAVSIVNALWSLGGKETHIQIMVRFEVSGERMGLACIPADIACSVKKFQAEELLVLQGSQTLTDHKRLFWRSLFRLVIVMVKTAWYNTACMQ